MSDTDINEILVPEHKLPDSPAPSWDPDPFGRVDDSPVPDWQPPGGPSMGDGAGQKVA